MTTKNPKLFSIGISQSTKERLEKRRHPNQSWNGIIEEMLNKLDTIETNISGHTDTQSGIKPE